MKSFSNARVRLLVALHEVHAFSETHDMARDVLYTERKCTPEDDFTLVLLIWNEHLFSKNEHYDDTAETTSCIVLASAKFSRSAHVQLFYSGVGQRVT